MNAARLMAAAALTLVALACGKDYRPPELETTGVPAAPLGQVLDLEVSLPSLQVPGSITRGADLELTLDIDGTGPGRHQARVSPGIARYDMTSAAVELLSGGDAEVRVSADSWITDTLGPFRIGEAVFEVLLEGRTADGGWTVSGSSWESQSGLRGSFRGWRRQRFLVAATDFFAGGSLFEVSLVKRGEIRVSDRLEVTGTDPLLRRSGRSVFVVNRLGDDNVQRLDPEREFRTSWQAGMGVGSNPHDVALVSADRAYVTRFEPPFDDVAVISPRGGTILSTIPLEELAENRDGTPRPDRIVELGGELFVGLQDIDRTFTRYADGKLAVIDAAGGRLSGSIPLGGKNPGTIEIVRGADGRDRLYVALAGIFPGLLPQELSGGVAVVDPVDRAVERLALDDDDAGGNVGALAMVSESFGYVVVSDDAYVNRVTAFDASTGVTLRTVFETRDLISEIEVGGGGVLAVPDRSFASPRLCLYGVPDDPAGSEIPLGCADLPLPPFSLEALD